MEEERSTSAHAPSPPIVFTGVLTSEESAVAVRCLGIVESPLKERWSHIGIFIVIGIVFAFAPLPILFKLEMGLIVFFGAYLSAGRHWVLPWMAERRSRKHAKDSVETTVTLGNERIQLEDAKIRLRFPWNYVTQVVEGQHGLIFCRGIQGYWFFLPERVFTDRDVRMEVVSMALRNNVKVTSI